MLKLNNVNLIRSSSYYHNDSIKNYISNVLTSPVRTIVSSQTTEFFLKDVSLQIEKNERVAILGKNGSGKSTLCRLIASQLFPASGTITNSFDTRLFSQIEHSFYGELSGRENLNYFIKFIYNDLSTNDQLILLNEAVEFSELSSAIDRQVETYSSGMISRLALSLILAKKHDLLLLDEIQTYSDSGFRKKVSERLQNIIKASNTVVIVSHYIDEITAVCKRGIVIEGGKIIFDGNIEKAIAGYRLISGEINA